MSNTWKGTKEKVYPIELGGWHVLHDTPFYEGANVLDSDEVGEEVAKANCECAADAINTIQQCDLMPSQLLEQNKQLGKLVSIALEKAKENAKLKEAAKKLLYERGQHGFFLEGYRNGSASISECMDVGEKVNQAAEELGKLL